ncbi:MAG: hypothetical protein LBP92_11690 [Deltaproteobacteria bacterium]|nr:hypothetical protein [Deltaproteobacteria bacterium]
MEFKSYNYDELLQQQEEFLSLELSIWTINCMIGEIIFYLFNSKNLTSDKLNELHIKRKLLNEERDKLYSGDKHIRKILLLSMHL